LDRGRQLMADEDHLACEAALLEGPGNAPLAGADIVDGGDVRMLLEVRPCGAVGFPRVVPHLGQVDNVEIGKFLGKDMPETGLALLVSPIGSGSGKQRDLVTTRPEQPPHEIAGEATGTTVVDPDIADARH